MIHRHAASIEVLVGWVDGHVDSIYEPGDRDYKLVDTSDELPDTIAGHGDIKVRHGDNVYKFHDLSDEPRDKISGHSAMLAGGAV